MTRQAAETLICPVCRKPPEAWPLDPIDVRCVNPACRQQFPRIGPGIPVLLDGTVNDLVEQDIVGDLEPLTELPAKLAKLDVGGSVWETFFQSTNYVVSHYLDRPNPFLEILDRLLPAVSDPIERIVDLGCGVGSLAIEVAHRTGGAAIGLDSNPTSLRWAVLSSRGEPFECPVRRTASRWDWVSVRPRVRPEPGAVSWVCGDLMNPPLSAEAFDLALLVNTLDSVRDPWTALGQASALLRPGGHLILAQPDAWMAQVAPASRWLAETSEEWSVVLAEVGLHPLARIDDIRWVLNRTDRMRFSYRMHATIAIRGPWPTGQTGDGPTFSCS